MHATDTDLAVGGLQLCKAETACAMALCEFGQFRKHTMTEIRCCALLKVQLAATLQSC